MPVMALLPAILRVLFLASTVFAQDLCSKVAGKQYVLPQDALNCLRSFPFNETIRQNVLENAEKVLNFYSFESYYYNSPAPFEESTVDIRAELARIKGAQYECDYDFHRDLYKVTRRFNDGHTGWFPCYSSLYQNLLPAPIVSLADEKGEENVYIAPDAVEFLELIGTEFTTMLDSTNFDWRRIAGAKVISIDGIEPYRFVDRVASTASGVYLDHNVRVNSVFSSYRLVNGSYSQRIGDFAGPVFPEKSNLPMSLLLVNHTEPTNVVVPFIANYLRTNSFRDMNSFWNLNCAAKNTTNGVDIKVVKQTTVHGMIDGRKPARAAVLDFSAIKSVALPNPYIPTLPQISVSGGSVIKSYLLPDKQTAVLFVGTFDTDHTKFQLDVESSMKSFERSRAKRLIIDVTNNGGGLVCLGHFLHTYIAGTDFGYAGFESSIRSNEIGKKIAEAQRTMNLTHLNYFVSNWADSSRGQQLSPAEDLINPTAPLNVNGRGDRTTRRILDICSQLYAVKPPAKNYFDHANIAIVGNGNCASTCALFTTAMREGHNTTVAVFGGNKDYSIEYKGMAGNQVLDWVDLDTEIKSANLKNDPLAPPDLIVGGNFRVNWRSAWSWNRPNTPIAYVSDSPKRFPYTKETYNNPQKLWTYAAKVLFQ